MHGKFTQHKSHIACKMFFSIISNMNFYAKNSGSDYFYYSKSDFYPNLFRRKGGDIVIASVCLSVTLSPLKLLDGFKQNLVCALLVLLGHARACLFLPMTPEANGAGQKGLTGWGLMIVYYLQQHNLVGFFFATLGINFFCVEKIITPTFQV